MITFNNTCAHYMWVIAETVLQDGVENGLILWRQWMAPKRECAKGCMFGLETGKRVCAQCLEGRLRTMNLYHPTPQNVDCIFLRAANAVKQWSEGTCEAKPSAA